MSKNFLNFYRTSLKNLEEAIVNTVLFLPYFFSLPALFKTLFSPWKNLHSKKNSVGFSLTEWLNRLSFDLISKTIGLLMRVSIILFYFLVQSLFIVTLPIIIIIFIIFIPVLYLENLAGKSEEEKKDAARLAFISRHLINQENFAVVSAWFEDYYQTYLHQQKWWKRSNLFSLPPLARDWSAGFTPTLDEYSEDLTLLAYQSKIVNIVDREKEIDSIERILSKSGENNVLISGEEGVGKHTVIDALAKKIYEGKTKSNLMYKRILKLNLEKILASNADFKIRENILSDLFQEALEAKNVIIFIDDFDKYITSDASRIDLSLIFEKFARKAQLQFIGITTPFFYQKYIAVKENLNHFFQKIDVYEVSQKDAEKILLSLVFAFEKRYSVSIPYETVQNAILKSDFYITEIPFPEKAIDLIDSACVLAIQKATSEVDEHHKKTSEVNPSLIDEVLTEKTHIPTTLTGSVKQKLIHFEELLRNKIVQQDEAVKKLSSTLRRSFLLMGIRKKPLASFLFLGPTGVGKTETAKAVANIFFGSDAYLIRFDMSLYQSIADIQKLIGSFETGNPGLLTTAIRKNPYGVLLLDEIEKANVDLINIFLTVLDEAYITDGFGRKVDCKNLVVIATSNAGSDLLYKQNQSSNFYPLSSNLINYLIENHIFSPEFLNRFDGVITYQPLTNESIRVLAKKMITLISDNIFKLHKVKLNVSDGLIGQLIDKSYDRKFGARNMERIIRDEIEDKIAKLVLENKVKEGETINI